MKWWAERMNIEIAKWLNADIATTIWSKDCYDAHSMGFLWEIIEVNPDFRKGILGFLQMKWSFFHSRNITGKYSHILFSNEAITGIWKTKSTTKTYYYAHSISRHLFDQRLQYLTKIPFFLRPFFVLFSFFLRWMYKKEITKIGTIFVNSQENKKRIAQWCGRDDAIILYPSVDTEKFVIYDQKVVSEIIAIEGIVEWYKWYYLSFARLTHAKRIDTIIRAFRNLPDKKVIILYGENDSQKDEFIKLGKWYTNISFLKLIDNNNLPSIISWSIATICISESEDFWMVAIESMACWVPVISTDEWGYRETMIDGKTGYMIDPKNLQKNLIKIIIDTSSGDFGNMQFECREHALEFSLSIMNTRMKQYFK